MELRLDLAVEKRCDGVEPDNVDAYDGNDPGFPLTYEDQIDYNTFLAAEAHSRGLSVGLKNDLAQVEDLLDLFDWALNEECFQWDECGDLQPFIDPGQCPELRFHDKELRPRRLAPPVPLTRHACR
jgi:hypothetical protein